MRSHPSGACAAAAVVVAMFVVVGCKPVGSDMPPAAGASAEAPGAASDAGAETEDSAEAGAADGAPSSPPGDEIGTSTGAGTGAEGSEGPELVSTVTDVPCESDADCAKNDCCHATTCVAVAAAPTCGDVMCTLECRGGTMDCGGGCACQSGKCVATTTAPDAFAPD